MATDNEKRSVNFAPLKLEIDTASVTSGEKVIDGGSGNGERIISERIPII